MNVKFDEVYDLTDNFIHVQKASNENQYVSKKAFTYDDILSSMNLLPSAYCCGVISGSLLNPGGKDCLVGAPISLPWVYWPCDAILAC